jgi:hypothetical protein
LGAASEEGALMERFWSKVDKRGPDECWEWRGHRLRAGYGRFGRAGRFPCGQSAHRISWFLTNGPIPDGFVIRHSCDNPPCCNPAHLIAGTYKENTADMLAKGRHPHGETHYSKTRPEKVIRGDRHYLRKNPQRVAGSANPFAKLDERRVRQLRFEVEAGRAIAAVAADYGVSASNVYLIVRRKAWGHVS